MHKVSFKQIFPDVSPESLSDSEAGHIKKGLFFPSGSVSEYFMEKQREYNNKNSNNKTNLYFIQCSQGGYIKIGLAKNVDARLESLQTGNPFRLSIIGVIENIDPSLEKKLHKKYSKYHVLNEWFTADVLKEIKENK